MKPIELTLYDPETNEIIKTYTRSFIPWRILKRALHMKSIIGGAEMTEADVDEITALVVAVFGDQFTIEEADNGTDLGEMATVVRSVIARAALFVEGKNAPDTAGSNPPTPAG